MPDQTDFSLPRQGEGNPMRLDQLFGQVYDELRAIAHHRLRQHRPGRTLDTTGLVHEAYLRLVEQSAVQPQDRNHFLALASRAMRFIVVDYARTRMRQKRGGGRRPVPLDALQVAMEDRAADLVALDEALDQLAGTNRRLSQLVEYRFFGGLSHGEIAELTGRSVPTVKRDWSLARAWLYRAMQAAPE